MDKEYFIQTFHASLSAATPLYVQLSNYLRGQIESGNFKPGEKMLPEEEICKITGISRSTVRQAMNQLVEQGILMRLRGKGTFVTEQKLCRSIDHLYSFTSDIKSMNNVPSSKVLKCSVVDIRGTYIQEKLQLDDSSTSVFQLMRLRMASGVPIVLEDTYIPYYLCGGIEKYDFENLSLYDTLVNRYNIIPSRASETLRAVYMEVKEQKLLESEANAIGYRISRIARSKAGQIFEFTTSITRADKCSFHFELFEENKIEPRLFLI